MSDEDPAYLTHNGATSPTGAEWRGFGLSVTHLWFGLVVLILFHPMSPRDSSG